MMEESGFRHLDGICVLRVMLFRSQVSFVVASTCLSKGQGDLESILRDGKWLALKDSE